MPMLRKNINIGDRFGKLAIVEEIRPKINTNRRFLCKCDCGKLKEINLSVLGKSTNSCGCILLESNKIHGLHSTRIYRIYNGIQSRCKDVYSKNYGGRGIKCEWNSFEEFYRDMGGSYIDGLSIDRKDNNGNYSKDNCKWSNNKEQSNNRRTNINILYLGKMKTLKQWCELKGLKYQKMRDRIQKYKWSAEMAFETK